MNLFKLHTLLYLSLHAVGFGLMMAAVLGIPGKLEEDKPIVKMVSKILNVLFLTGWYGIPFLVIGSALAFFFYYDVIGQVLSILSVTIGACLLLMMIVLYNVK